MENTLTQNAILLYCAYGGALIGIVYDLLSLMRIDRVWLNAVLDLVFWCAAFTICATLLMRANGLQPRIFTLVGFALGFAVYKLTLGRLARTFLRYLRRALVYIIEGILGLLE